MKSPRAAFTVIELLVVMTIILVLAGLILATSSYVQKKGARSRAEAEIAAMSAALENYKADNGTYPRDTNTDSLNAAATPAPSPSSYTAASFHLFTKISGLNASQASTGEKSYFNFKPQVLGGVRDSSGNITTVQYIRDPFGNSYGYSTAYAYDVERNLPPAHGYNPTFDLWSTSGDLSGDQNQWIKNW